MIKFYAFFDIIFRNPSYSNIVIEISWLSSNCSISIIFGGNSILSIFNHSQRFNKFLDILFGCFLSVSS